MKMPHISLMKNMAIFGVFALHALLPFVSKKHFWQLHASKAWLPADYMANVLAISVIPMLVFASGYLLQYSRERYTEPLWLQMLRRGRRLLVPWFLAMVLWLVPLYQLFNIPSFNRPLGYTLAQTYTAGFLGLFTDHLWFLLMLFWVTMFWLAALPFERGRVKSGAAIAVIAALVMDEWGKGLVWYCLWEITPFILYFYLGILCCRERDAVDKWIWKNPLPCLAAFVLLTALATASSTLPPRLGWLLSLAYCAASYALCLIIETFFGKSMAANKYYTFFERNSLFYYLFHSPTVLLIFMFFNALGRFIPIHPALCVVLNIALTVAITTAVVQGFNIVRGKFEEIAAGRPKVGL